MSFRALQREFNEVIIIDLLPANERRDWHLSEDLRDWLADKGVEQFQLSCSTKEHVFQALDWSIARAAATSFVLHFTAHGNANGIGLKASNELITWNDLRSPLQRLNSAFGGDLLVNMTACQGFNATDIQNLVDPADPFYGLIGPTCSPSPELARRMSQAFYQGLLDGKDIPQVIQQINVSEGGNVIWCRTHQHKRNLSF